MTFTNTYPNFIQNLNINGYSNRNINIDQDYNYIGESNDCNRYFKTNGHNNLDVRAEGDINREYLTPGKIKLDINCSNYKNNLTIGNKKYVMKEIRVKGKKMFVYVLDDATDDTNDDTNDDDDNDVAPPAPANRVSTSDAEVAKIYHRGATELANAINGTMDVFNKSNADYLENGLTRELGATNLSNKVSNLAKVIKKLLMILLV